MKPRYKASGAAINLIKSFEGFRGRAARLDDGRWTVGYGHTLSTKAGAQVTPIEAEALLTYDLIGVEEALNTLIFSPLSQNQFDALCAFVYNVGIEAFRESDVLKAINEGQFLRAAYAMELWRRAEFQGASLIVDAIVRRRAAEKALFLMPTEGWVPAPSTILQPQLDTAAVGLMTREAPTDLAIPLEGTEATIQFATHLAETPPPAVASSIEAAEPVVVVADLPDTIASPPAPEPLLEPLPEPSPANAWTQVERRRVSFVPFRKIGIPAVLLAIGGVYWSGYGSVGTGALHPVVVGGVLCLLGLAGISYTAYRLLIDLGYIEPVDEAEP